RRPRLIAVALAGAMALGLASSCSRDTPESADGAAGTQAAGEARTASIEDLAARARQYLELKQRHAWAEVYDDILDPELKNQLERQRFLKKREKAFDILGFEIVSAEQEGEV